MRAVAVLLVAAASVVGCLPPVAAAPPEDLAAYCRSVHPQMQFQVRCMNLEQAAATRVARSGPTTNPEAWARCQSSSASWSAVEICLREATRAAVGAGGGAVGPAIPTAAPATDPSGRRPDEGAGPPAGTAKAAPPTPPAPPTPAAPAAAPPSPSTVILGPRPSPTAPQERDRPTRSVTEADADRQLRGVLEREGDPKARCTKKQYGPGWVMICE